MVVVSLWVTTMVLSIEVGVAEVLLTMARVALMLSTMVVVGFFNVMVVRLWITFVVSSMEARLVCCFQQWHNIVVVLLTMMVGDCVECDSGLFMHCGSCAID